MRYLVTAEEMRGYDRYMTEEVGIPAMVLMERAALAAFRRIEEYFEENRERERRVLVMAGMGNNGGDGLALARLLAEAGYFTSVWCVGDASSASGQWKLQKRILNRYPVSFVTKPEREEYTILIDALFGAGLSREINGIYREAVEIFNRLGGWKLALDLPSGVDSDTGRIRGVSVQADETLAFGFCKRGLVLYPGCTRAGTVRTVDVGISRIAFHDGEPGMFALDEREKELLPLRDPQGNKGTFGRVLLAAGSINMAGAAILAARAAYRTGAGMVKVITPPENRVILQTAVPEALPGTEADLEKSLEWADVIVVGPGLGTDGRAMGILEKLIRESSLPLLIDADGLNLTAEREELRALLAAQGRRGRSIVLTPHMGELSRLTGRSIPELKEDPAGCGSELAMELQAVVAVKDARTVVCQAEGPVCVNLSGCSGLATAGSGDVLAGMIAGLMAQGMGAFRAACVGACIHGRRGEQISAGIGEHACMAGDLLRPAAWLEI